MTESTWDLLTDPDDSRHGTVSGYTNHGCRCPRCTEAATEAAAKNRDDRSLREPPEGTHGTAGCYTNWKCRRPECRAAYNTLVRDRRARQRRNREAS